MYGILERALFTGEDGETLLLYNIMYKTMDMLLLFVVGSERACIREAFDRLVESLCEIESSEDDTGDRYHSDEEGNTGEDYDTAGPYQSTENAAHGM